METAGNSAVRKRLYNGLTAAQRRRFRALAVKEALKTITVRQLLELERLSRKRGT